MDKLNYTKIKNFSPKTPYRNKNIRYRDKVFVINIIDKLLVF